MVAKLSQTRSDTAAAVMQLMCKRPAECTCLAQGTEPKEIKPCGT